LKPNYNSVDFVEIEIVDNKREPREFDQELLAVGISFTFTYLKLNFLLFILQVLKYVAFDLVA